VAEAAFLMPVTKLIIGGHVHMVDMSAGIKTQLQMLGAFIAERNSILAMARAEGLEYSTISEWTGLSVSSIQRIIYTQNAKGNPSSG
jgi:hypothetical protein